MQATPQRTVLSTGTQCSACTDTADPTLSSRLFYVSVSVWPLCRKHLVGSQCGPNLSLVAVVVVSALLYVEEWTTASSICSGSIQFSTTVAVSDKDSTFVVLFFACAITVCMLSMMGAMSCSVSVSLMRLTHARGCVC